MLPFHCFAEKVRDELVPILGSADYFDRLKTEQRYVETLVAWGHVGASLSLCTSLAVSQIFCPTTAGSCVAQSACEN